MIYNYFYDNISPLIKRPVDAVSGFLNKSLAHLYAIYKDFKDELVAPLVDSALGLLLPQGTRRWVKDLYSQAEDYIGEISWSRVRNILLAKSWRRFRLINKTFEDADASHEKYGTLDPYTATAIMTLATAVSVHMQAKSEMSSAIIKEEKATIEKIFKYRATLINKYEDYLPTKDLFKNTLTLNEKCFNAIMNPALTYEKLPTSKKFGKAFWKALWNSVKVYIAEDATSMWLSYVAAPPAALSAFAIITFVNVCGYVAEATDPEGRFKNEERNTSFKEATGINNLKQLKIVAAKLQAMDKALTEYPKDLDRALRSSGYFFELPNPHSKVSAEYREALNTVLTRKGFSNQFSPVKATPRLIPDSPFANLNDSKRDDFPTSSPNTGNSDNSWRSRAKQTDATTSRAIY
jgi:hypothetical protein